MLILAMAPQLKGGAVFARTSNGAAMNPKNDAHSASPEEEGEEEGEEGDEREGKDEGADEAAGEDRYEETEDEERGEGSYG